MATSKFKEIQMLFRSIGFYRERLASRALLVLVAACFSAGPAAAQSEVGFPNKPVRLLIGFPPGGAADTAGRELARGLQAVWGQPVVVDNRPGASGAIAAEVVVRAPPDGTTLFLASEGPIISVPFLQDKLSYNPLTDLTPLGMAFAVPNVLVVNGKSPYKTFRDFIAAAKARPGALDYASSGKGESHHMMMEYMMKETGTKLNDIPYKGGAPALLAVASGEVAASWVAVSTAMPLIKSGQLLGLAINQLERMPQAPDIPTAAEQGYPGFQFISWQGVMGPANMPAALIKKIEADIQTVVNSPTYREQMLQRGILPRFEPSEQFARTVRQGYARNKATLQP